METVHEDDELQDSQNESLLNAGDDSIENESIATNGDDDNSVGDADSIETESNASNDSDDDSDSEDGDDSDSIETESNSSQSTVHNDDSDNEDIQEDSDANDGIFDPLLENVYTKYDAQRRKAINAIKGAINEFGLDENNSHQSPADITHKLLIPYYKKSLKELFAQDLLRQRRKRRHPISKAITKRIRKLKEKGYDDEEATLKAVSDRKYLIYRLIPAKRHASNKDDDDDDTSESDGETEN